MSRRGPGPWALFWIWCVWIYALLGRLVAEPVIGSWAPDLGLILLLGLEPRLSRREALLGALLLALARATFSADPAVAILAGYLAAAGAAGALRSVVLAEDALARAVVTGILAGGLGLFWALVRQARLLPELGSFGLGARGLGLPLDEVGRTALATGVASFVLLPLLVRLPGLTSLRERSV